jgi:replicative DNA helicase
MTERLLPHNIDAEKAVIGGILVEQSHFFSASEILKPEHFYLESHRLIFQAMQDLRQAQTPIDTVTLIAELRRRGWIEKAGGVPAVAALTDGTPAALNVRHYADLVSGAASHRRLISDLNEHLDQAWRGEVPCKDIVESLQGKLLQFDQDRGTGLRPAAEFVSAAFKQIEETATKKICVSGLETGFRELDRLTQGFKPGQLVILAARPGEGKTTLAQNMTDHLVTRKNKSVAVFSLEMSGVELATRAICAETPMDAYEIPAGKLDWSRIAEVCSVLSGSGLYIDESAGLTINEIRSRAQRLAVEKHIDLVVVDYLQLMSGSGRRGETREREISEISRGLKILAKELQVPVLALSQLNRDLEKTGRRPHLADLRESGSLEQDADLVLLLWRDRTDEAGPTQLILAKQRNGRADIFVKLDFYKRFNRFRER